ncbi:MAG: outer membrane protein assembly factor BamD [Acidobacteria bacterium]|jgi:outer membrane protein assembly factor BamD|nr:outer membrane protein assembly factor BamD [Acidobacteriota bacterium]
MQIRFPFFRVTSRASVAVLLVALAALATGACGSAATRLPPAGLMDADQWLFERGTESLADRKWYAAREYFRRLVDGYPQSVHREDAKLGIGDTYIGDNSIGSNILAINEFQEFLTFFPVSPRADYAQYGIALAYSRQMLAPQRDQTATRDTIRELEVFLQRYPDSALKSEAEALERTARDRLSQSEYEIGFFYARFGICKGAVDRFRSVLVADPGFTNRDAVYFQMGECLVKMGAPAEALPWYERLKLEFEKSEYLEKAQKRIDELKGGIPQFSDAFAPILGAVGNRR